MVVSPRTRWLGLLHEVGERVGLVVFFDTLNPVLQPWSLRERLDAHVDNLRRRGAAYLPNRVTSRVREEVLGLSRAVRAASRSTTCSRSVTTRCGPRPRRPSALIDPSLYLSTCSWCRPILRSARAAASAFDLTSRTAGAATSTASSRSSISRAATATSSAHTQRGWLRPRSADLFERKDQQA